MTPSPQDTEAELRDACINIQLKLGLDDKHWYKLCGNFEGLYGFIAAHTKQATDAARIDELNRFEKNRWETPGSANRYYIQRIAELQSKAKDGV